MPTSAAIPMPTKPRGGGVSPGAVQKFSLRLTDIVNHRALLDPGVEGGVTIATGKDSAGERLVSPEVIM